MVLVRGSTIALLFTITWFTGGVQSAQYFGKLIGRLSELHHGVSGEVYAVDGRTLYLKDFSYDGQGPAAYFYASTQRSADAAGFRVRDENGSPEVIRRYRKEGVTLTLPEGKTLNNIKIFYLWCEEFSVNFGDVKIPRSFDYPRPQKIEPLKGVHAISSDNIVIVDAQTLLIPNLSYDGEAPDAKFWVGRGPKPSPQGIRIPDENGRITPLRLYDKKTIVLTLPGDLTVFDIGHFGIWCEAFTVDFGHIQIPQNLNVPPSLKMLGVSPQSKLNCEVLYDDLAFEVRWAVAGDSIVLQLVAKLDEREYMSFGISGHDSKSKMKNGDVAVAWVDKTTLKGYAEDYFLAEMSQCSGPTGSCPDKRLADNSNNIRLLNAAMVNGYSIVTYQRPLKASDEFDKQIFTNTTQPIIWAIGPLNQRNEVSFHNHYTKGDQFLEFGRSPLWNCPMPESEQPPMKPVLQIKKEGQVSTIPVTSAPTVTPARSRNPERRRGSNRGTVKPQEVTNDSERSSSRTRQTERRGAATRGPQRGNSNSVAKIVPAPAPVSNRDAWEIPPIQCDEPDDGVFYAQMGPTGGKRGYPAITGHVGWGISWYINGLLIPEIHVVRGTTYNFVVEGGSDPDIPAKYHPFYITDDSVGGYEYKTDEEKKNVTIFSGVIFDKEGKARPTGTGRLCHWTHQGDSDADDFDSFGAYQRTLELRCDNGEPGVIQWTPDKNTPDTVYYQCFTHRYLGWKIHVHDTCDRQAAGSEPKASIVPAPSAAGDSKLDLEESPSIRLETRVKPNDLLNGDKTEDKDKSTISEKITVAPIIDPFHTNGQPQVQLPNEPILIQPHQSLFNHPPVFMSHGPFFAQNPYIFESPLFINPYSEKNTFRPSPTIDSFKENTELKSNAALELKGESIETFPNRDIDISVPTTAMVTTTTTTATTATIATTTITPTTSSESTSTTAKTTKLFNSGFSEKTVVASASEIIPRNQTLLPPPLRMQMQNIHSGANAVVRRPMGPIKYNRPPPFPMKMHSRPVFMRPPHQYKKPGQKPSRPLHFTLNKPMFFSDITPKRRPPNFVVLKPHTIAKIEVPTTALPTLNVRDVEISPQQASTEKEPEIQTAPPSEFLSSRPLANSYHFSKLPPALNTGFHPESVIVESGFKPIISREFQKRISEVEPELEYESEIGVIDLDNVEDPRIPQYFEPMFVPSPIDKALKLKRIKTHKKPYIKKVIIKHPRDLDVTQTVEPVPAAAERVESYYLPPLGQPVESKRIPNQPSNIDIEPPLEIDLISPPDIVVTYDGRRVSGASLTAKIASDRSSILDMRASKAAELIKAGPQFLPFKGELPPLSPSVINRNSPQFQVHGLLNRGLDAPSVQGGSTKLTLLRQIEDDKTVERRKRGAHHTPEHTAEQERQSRESSTSATKSGCEKNYSLQLVLSSIVVAYCLRLVN